MTSMPRRGRRRSFNLRLLGGALLLGLALLLQGLWPGGQDAGYNPQLAETLRLIDQGGPFPYHQDGTTFYNREGLLPSRPRGYYREYTVDTPGLSHRGPRRVVTGGDPPEVFYYTQDHYQSFVELERSHE
ncbi:ribonuclease [Zobellella taiwanensis]|uniref:Ribonuclease n=1 Tax=Zobellella taiwanensis TaxID=347535 RepID=A0A2P7RDJ3_9GAMM|nr:ribonuclease domain-containing protein [Zobellella taiwanensis]PSJ48281.1 ribonuclease [Zobellella taiwanensis]